MAFVGGDYLGNSGQSPERGRIEDAIAIPLKGQTIINLLVWVEAIRAASGGRIWLLAEYGELSCGLLERRMRQSQVTVRGELDNALRQ